MEDLIQNAHTLFDERRSRPASSPSIGVAETKSTHTHGSSPVSAEVHATDSTS